MGLVGARRRAIARPCLDATPVAEDRQFAVWRALTPAARVAAWAERSAMVQALAETGGRRDRRRASDREVCLRRVALAFDRATMRRCRGVAMADGATP
jgi:hypothetical protein